MKFLIEENNDKIYLKINGVNFCYFTSGKIINSNQFSIGTCIASISDANDEINIDFNTKDFEVISVFFDFVNKVSAKIYSVSVNSSEYYLKVENSTIIANKNLIIGVSNAQKMTINSSNSFPHTQNNVFKAQMYIPDQPTQNVIFKSAPSFSITFYSDILFEKPLSSYKDKQIINGLSTVYAKVVSDQKKVNSIYKLNSINANNSVKEYNLTYNSAGFSSTQISFSASDFVNYFDGSLKFFVSIQDFVFSNTIQNKTIIQSSIAQYHPITTMSGSFSTSHFNSGNFRIGASTFSWNSIGYSTITPTPIYINDSTLNATQTFPTLNTSAFVPISYSTSYNGYIGASLIYNFGTSGIGFSTVYDWAGVTFIAEEDLSSPVNTNSYNVEFLFNYSENNEPTVVNPIMDNVFSSTISTSTIPYSYNFVSALIPFNQSIDTSKTLTSFEARIFKSANYLPQVFRVHEWKIFNYKPVTVQQFNAFKSSGNSFNALSNESQPKTESENLLGISIGDKIYGYNGSVTQTSVIQIYEGIVENIYQIETDKSIIEIPESFKVIKDNLNVNLWDLKVDDMIRAIDGYAKIVSIKLNNYKPHFVVETELGNYYANKILVEPQITIYHKKTKSS